MEETFDILDARGCYTGKTATRDECHRAGHWHKAVAIFIINSQGQVLLQKRSASKKLWPDMWDVSAGGHVLAGEFGFQAAIRECQEELGLSLTPSDLTFIGATSSTNRSGDIINNHFNEYYIVHQDLNPTTLTLQAAEVSEAKWMDRDEIIRRIQNHYEGITDKDGCWEYLVEYYNWLKQQST